MECVLVANAKGLYGFSRTFETLTSTLRSSENCTAFLIDCTDQDSPTNAHLNRLSIERDAAGSGTEYSSYVRER